MRWVTFTVPDHAGERAGMVVDGRIHACAPGTTLLGLLGDDGTRLAAEGDAVQRDPRDVLELDAVRLLAPIPRPPTVRDFYAFEQHVRTARQRRGLEMDPDWYELPVFYFSNPYAVCGPDDDVAIPPGSVELDYELEVAAVVGLGGADLDPERGATLHRRVLRDERLECSRYSAARDEAQHGTGEGQGLCNVARPGVRDTR